MDWAKAERMVEGIYRKSCSVHSRHFYSFGVRKLKQYCDEKSVEIVQGNVYESLDGYVAWLVSKGLKPKTVVDYTSAAKRVLVYQGIDIDEKKFRNVVSMPRVFKIEEEPLTLDKVRRILTVGKPNANTRALILVLLSSGMRLSEALKVTMKDLDLDSEPARVRLRAEITKGKRARVAYLSDEAASAVREITEEAPSERLLFEYSGDIWSRTKIVTVTFRRVVKRCGLGEKIENHRIHKVHFHLLRKYFLTKGSDVIGEHAAHALCGHGFYMDTYYQKNEEERAADYLKLMPHLSVFSKPETSKEEILSTFNRQFLSMAGYADDEISELGDLSALAPAQVQELIRKKSMDGLGLNGNSQKVVPMSEVKKWVLQGWDFVTGLPQDEAIIRLPSATH